MGILDFFLRRDATVDSEPSLSMTARDLAVALHAVENEGRIGRFGAAYCAHDQKANAIFDYLRQRGATS